MDLRYLVNKPKLSGRLARWILLLSGFEYTVQYKSGKMHLETEHLSKLSSNVSKENMDDEFTDDQLFAIRKAPS